MVTLARKKLNANGSLWCDVGEKKVDTIALA